MLSNVNATNITPINLIPAEEDIKNISEFEILYLEFQDFLNVSFAHELQSSSLKRLPQAMIKKRKHLWFEAFLYFFSK